MICCQDGDPCTIAKALFTQPAPNRFSHTPRLGIGEALQLVLVLDFKTDVLRPAFGTLAEEVVKGRHEFAESSSEILHGMPQNLKFHSSVASQRLTSGRRI